MSAGGGGVPPAFVEFGCHAVIRLGRIVGLSGDMLRNISPHLLRNLRNSTASNEEIRLGIEIVQRAPHFKNLGNVIKRTFSAHPDMLYATICWLLIQYSCFNHVAIARSFRNLKNRLQFTVRTQLTLLKELPSPPVYRCHSVLNNSGSLNLFEANVIAMSYGKIIHQLRKYRQLDAARVQIFQEIKYCVEKLVQLLPNLMANSHFVEYINRHIPNAPDSIGASGLNRIFENLWDGVQIFETTSPKSRYGQVRSDLRLRTSTGIEQLSNSYELMKSASEESTMCNTHAAAFLKWSMPACAYSTENITELSEQLNAAFPSTGTDAGKEQMTQHCSPPKPPNEEMAPNLLESSNESESVELGDSHIDKLVVSNIDVFSELEGSVLQLLGNNLGQDILNDVVRDIDSQFASMGLSYEEIDKEAVELNVRNNSKVDRAAALYNKRYSGTSSEDLLEYQRYDVLYSYLQQQLCVPNIPNKIEELDELRALHETTLRRVANACTKYCPFDIVINDKKTVV